MLIRGFPSTLAVIRWRSRPSYTMWVLRLHGFLWASVCLQVFWQDAFLCSPLYQTLILVLFWWRLFYSNNRYVQSFVIGYIVTCSPGLLKDCAPVRLFVFSYAVGVAFVWMLSPRTKTVFEDEL